MLRLRRLGGVLAAVLLLAPVAASSPQDAVTGAGKAQLWWGETSWVLHAVQGDAAPAADGRLTMRTPHGSTVVDVSCVRPVAGRVLVGGIIVDDTNPSAVGHGMGFVLEDGVPPAKDRVGLAFGPTVLAECPVDVLDAITRYDELLAGNFVVLAD